MPAPPMTRKTWLTSTRDWLRGADLQVITGLVAIGVLVLVFIRLGSAVSGAGTDDFDQAVLLALRDAPDDPIGPPAFEGAVMHLSALGSGAVTSLVVLIAASYLALSGRRRYALLVIGCAVGTLIAMAALKGLFDRPRPSVVTHIDPPGGESFPSGHSMISAALYPMLAVLIARTLPTRKQRVFVIAAGAFLALLVGVTRLYLGVHYPTDVLAGWTVGLSVALIGGVVARRISVRRSKTDV
jgi:undecaprenyl-diphosphatase